MLAISKAQRTDRHLRANSQSHSRYFSNTTLLRIQSPEEGIELEARRTASNEPTGTGTTGLEMEPMKEADARADPRFRDGARTPPPTPEEMKFLTETSSNEWKRMKTKKYWTSKETITQMIILMIQIGFIVVFVVENHNFVQAYKPKGQKVKDLPAGWLIPVAILVVISIPPLFGHEFILLLIGITYGVWQGFVIAIAGTLIGETLSFCIFRFLCHTRLKKHEPKMLQYAGLAELIRTGGFQIVLTVRYTSIPSHLTAAIFGLCEVDFIPFIVAAVLSLPKQIMLVYVGVAYGESGSGDETSQTKAITAALISVISVVTILALSYINRMTDRVRDPIVYRRRKERQEKYARAADFASTSGSLNTVYEPQPCQIADPWRTAEEGQFCPLPTRLSDEQ